MRNKGFTLVEALVAMVILSLIGGTLLLFFPTSAKLFQRGGAESQAESKCARAVKKMAPYVREAMSFNVVVRDAGSGEIRLEISQPLKQHNDTVNANLVVYPPTVGTQLAFYRSDSTGNPNVIGTYFWRAEWANNAWQPGEMLASGITSFTAPTVDTLSPIGVEVVVKSHGTLGTKSADITHREYLMCRNS